MKLEDQVCSLELAKRLKELGVKQESLFWWATFTNMSAHPKPFTGAQLVDENEIEDMEERSYLKNLEKFSAFTVAELGEMLKKGSFPEWDPEFQEWRGRWKYKFVIQHDGTEAAARALMLIYLIENGLTRV